MIAPTDDESSYMHELVVSLLKWIFEYLSCLVWFSSSDDAESTCPTVRIRKSRISIFLSFICPSLIDFAFWLIATVIYRRKITGKRKFLSQKDQQFIVISLLLMVKFCLKNRCLSALKRLLCTLSKSKRLLRTFLWSDYIRLVKLSLLVSSK